MGNGNVTFNANSTNVHFIINGDNVTINGINFINFKGSANGGAILLDGSNNKIANCTFINCSSISSNANYGGAIYVSKSNGSIANCEFTNCSGAEGGTIYFGVGSNYGNVVDCTFTSCSSKNYGGAIFFDESHYANVDNCSFINCSSSDDSGAISGYYSDYVKIANCNFNDCYAKNFAAGILLYGFGGSILNCSFTNCHTNGSGSAIFIGESDNMTIANCNFTDCYSILTKLGHAQGSAIRCELSNYLKIANCTFTDCYSRVTYFYGSQSVGAILLYACHNGTMINCTFDNCSSQCSSSNSKAFGGALAWVQSHDGYVAGCTFINCVSDGAGGAIFWDSSDNGSLTNSTFINCTSSYSGGAIYWEGYYGTIENTTIINSTSGFAGAIYWDLDYGTIFNCNFTNCTSTGDWGGGAILWDWCVGGVIANSTFTNCSSETEAGGAIRYDGSDNGLVTNNTFINCTAKTGGAVAWVYGDEYCTAANGTLTNNNFFNCYDQYGAAIYNECDNITINGGNGAVVYNDYYGTILDNKTVTILENKSMGVANNTVVKLKAVIKTGNYTIIGSFPVTFSTNQSEIITAQLEGDGFVANYPITDNVVINASCGINNVAVIKTEELIVKIPVDVVVDNITVPYNQTIKVNVSSTANGTAYITVNNTNYSCELINGEGIIILPKLDCGTHNLTVIYAENADYLKASSNFTINVTQINSTLIISIDNITYGENATLMIATTKEATGNITIKINSKDYSVSLRNTKLNTRGLSYVSMTIPVTTTKLNIPNLDAGEYELIAIYNGDRNFKMAFKSIKFKVFKANTTLNIEVEDSAYGKEAVIVVTLGDNLTDNLTVSINGTDYNITVNNGKGTLKLLNLSAGDYLIEASFTNENYNTASNTANIKVNKINTSLPIVVEDITGSVVIKVDSRATGNITMEIDGKKFTKAVENGTVIFKVPKLAIGEYNLIVSYSGDNNFNQTTNSTTFTVISNETINGKDLKADNSLLKTGNPLLVFEVLLAILSVFVIRRKY